MRGYVYDIIIQAYLNAQRRKGRAGEEQDLLAGDGAGRVWMCRDGGEGNPWREWGEM
jgi:hypothetical protein